MLNPTKTSTSIYKELTVQVNSTQIYIKDKSVYINQEVHTTLPFKNQFVTVKRETSVFIVISGLKRNLKEI